MSHCRFLEKSCRYVKLKKVSRCMLLSPKKGHVTMSFLGVLTPINTDMCSLQAWRTCGVQMVIVLDLYYATNDVVI